MIRSFASFAIAIGLLALPVSAFASDDELLAQLVNEYPKKSSGPLSKFAGIYDGTKQCEPPMMPASVSMVLRIVIWFEGDSMITHTFLRPGMVRRAQLKFERDFHTTNGDVLKLYKDESNLIAFAPDEIWWEPKISNIDPKTNQGSTQHIRSLYSRRCKNEAELVAWAKDERQTFAKSIAYYTEEIQRNPQDPRNYDRRGFQYSNNNEFDRAIADYDQALKLDPTFESAIKGRATVVRNRDALLSQTAVPSASARSAQLPTVSAIAIAKELVELKGGNQMFSPVISNVIDQTRAALLRTSPQLSKDLNDVATKLVAEFAPKRADLIAEAAKLYAANFTEQELKDMVTFFKSALGQKMIALEPSVLDETFKFIQSWGLRVSEEATSRFRAEMKKKGHNL